MRLLLKSQPWIEDMGPSVAKQSVLLSLREEIVFFMHGEK